MNLFAPSYRRPALIAPEFCEPRRPIVAAALSFHKGNASQAQTSTQTGAQDQGIVTQGSGNTSNTGTYAGGDMLSVLGDLTNTTQTAQNSGNTTAGGDQIASGASKIFGDALSSSLGGITIGSGGSYTVTDSGIVKQATDLLGNLLSDAAARDQAIIDRVVSSADQARADAGTLAQNAQAGLYQTVQTQQAKDAAVLEKLTALSDTKTNSDPKIVLYTLTALAVLGLGYAYLNRKK
jgi:hypothetical protein